MFDVYNVHHSWNFRHVFRSSETKTNNKNNLFYIWNLIYQDSNCSNDSIFSILLKKPIGQKIADFDF